jgi:hypothetical protein
MRGVDWLVLLSLLDNRSESPPDNFGGSNPLRGTWRLFKFFVFLFLLFWFLFHQNIFSIQVKPKWKEQRARINEHQQGPEIQRVHIVNSGETLSEIAAQTRVSSRLLMSLNHLENPNRIYPGQRLVLPAPVSE